jgi:hypothetical protein
MSREPPGWYDDAVDNPNKGDANARGRGIGRSHQPFCRAIRACEDECKGGSGYPVAPLHAGVSWSSNALGTVQPHSVQSSMLSGVGSRRRLTTTGLRCAYTLH